MNILLLCGSIRADSYNQALLNAASVYMPNHTLSMYAIANLPFYNPALDGVALDGDRRPQAVQDFMQLVSDADAIIIATPEYNFSIPAVLKNALDWASRPAYNSPLKGKPVTILSASPSVNGGNLVQAHLKLVLDGTLAVIYPSANFCLGVAHEKIQAGQLMDETAQERLQRHIQGFTTWAEKIIVL